MKIKYTLVFKSGIKKEHYQTATKEELEEVNDIIFRAFEGDRKGVLTLGDGDKKGMFVRINDLSMVEMEEVE